MNLPGALPAISFIVCMAPAFAAPIDKTRLIGDWQAGLTKSVRANISLSPAEKWEAGMVNAVMRFNADGSVLHYPPCGVPKEKLEYFPGPKAGEWQIKNDRLHVRLNWKGRVQEEIFQVEFTDETITMVDQSARRSEWGRYTEKCY